MIAMATKKEPPPKVYARTSPRLKAALDRVVTGLRSTERYIDRERKLSQEAVINASWLWMATLDPEELAKHLAPHIARFEAVWDAEEQTDGGTLSAPSVEHHQVIPPAQPKRRKAK